MSKFSEHHESIIRLYEKASRNVTETAKLLAAAIDVEYNDTFRRSLSSYINRHIDSSRNPNLLEHSDDFKAAAKKNINKSKYYIITSAQNATPVHRRLWNNILSYADFLGGEVIVQPIRYNNPTSVFSDIEHDTWVDEVKPYLCAKRTRLHDYLVLLADVKVQPTSSLPLSRKELMSGLDSCIIGHPRVHLKSVPRLPSYAPKVMATTGSVTEANYTDSDSGKVGEAHHTYGFIIVEIDGDIFHLRQVTADEYGNFIDLIHHVHDGKVEIKKKIEAISLGDLHIREHDDQLMQVTEELMDVLKPEHIVVHDVFTGMSVSPYGNKDPIERFHKNLQGELCLETEIEDVIEYLRYWVDEKKYNLVVSRSNHDIWLDRYIKSEDWKKDINNAKVYTKLLLVLLEGEAPKGLLPYLIEEEFGDKINCLGISDSFRIGDWELGFHGHMGLNGAKGSNNTFKKLSTKMIKAHDHSPSRQDGCISNGTSTRLRLGYNEGLTTWMQSHTIIHENNKAQQIMFIRHKFTTFEL